MKKLLRQYADTKRTTAGKSGMSGKRIINVMITAVLLLISACGTSSDSASDSREVYSPELAEKYAEEGNYEKALEVYTALIDEDPDNTDLYLGRAEVYVRTEKYPEATADYTQVVNIDNKNAEAHAKRGVLSYVTGDTEEGEKDLQEVAAITEEYSEEEKEELYEEVEEYILIFEFTSVRKEDTEDYYVTVYELEDGGTMILVHDREYLFTVDRFEAGEEVQVRPLNKKSVIWQTEPSIAGNEVSDMGKMMFSGVLECGIEMTGYPNKWLVDTEQVAAVFTDKTVYIYDYYGNLVSSAQLPANDPDAYKFLLDYTCMNREIFHYYVETVYDGIEFDEDFSIISPEAYYCGVQDGAHAALVYKKNLFVDTEYKFDEFVTICNMLKENPLGFQLIMFNSENRLYHLSVNEYKQWNAGGKNIICYIVDDSLNPVGTAVIGVDGSLISGSEYYCLTYEHTNYKGAYYYPKRVPFVNGYYAAAQTMSAVNSGKGPYTFVNASNGAAISDFVYEDLKWFEDGYAPVKKNGMWGFIDESGNEVTDFVFEDASILYEGKTFVKVNGKYGILDLKATIESGIPVTEKTING